MLQAYEKEAKMIKNSMLGAFVSILFIALTSLLIMVKGFSNWLLEIPILISFALAILSLVVSVSLIIAVMAHSVRTLNYEIKNDDEGIRFGL